MAIKRKGLGRGLDALLGDIGGDTAIKEAPRAAPPKASPAPAAPPAAGQVLPVDVIQPGRYQPRRDMQTESLQELADSIKAQGLLQPIVVRPIAADKYEIIAGERRWRASQLAGLDTIAAVVKDVGDEAALAMALIENLQREDLNPMEEAISLQRLLEEFELTQQQVADAVGKSRATVANLLRLMQLQAGVRTMLEHGDLEMGHARALLGASPDKQANLADQVVSKGLSVRQTEALVRQSLQPVKKPVSHRKDVNTVQLEEDLAEKLGTPVLIRHNAKGKGSIAFKFSDLDQLQGLLERLD